MKTTPCACLFLGICAVFFTAAYAQQEEKITITTYYPSASGVYQTIRLIPGNAPSNPRPGQLFFNNTTGLIQYYNKTGKWTNITGGAFTNNTVRLDNLTSPPVNSTSGRIYFNYALNTPQYLNKQGKWINWTGNGYWEDSSTKAADSDDPDRKFFRFVNTSWDEFNNKRVGIGTKTPKASLHVNIDEESGPDEMEAVAKFTKSLKGTAYLPQSMIFAIFPNGTYKPYLDSTSVVYVPRGNLMATTANITRTHSYHVGGYNSSASEVMVLTNPEGEDHPSPRLGIGNATPPFALFVDSKQTNTTAFGIRGKNVGYKLGISTITPYNDSAWITLNCYLENNTWKHDKYTRSTGTPVTKGAALVIKPSEGMKWHCYDGAGLIDGDTKVANWNIANESIKLWDRGGLIQNPSSRALKENFVPLNQVDLLHRIDQLSVYRWKYKAQTESSTHIGPMAEDFNSLFEFGKSGEYITFIDQAGVSLAGIQAISAAIKTQQQIINKLKAELNDLDAQLSRRGKQGGL